MSITAELTGYIWWAPLITIAAAAIAGYYVINLIQKRRKQKK